MTTSKSIAIFIVALFASLIIFPMSAHAAQLAPASFDLPPNATQVVKYKDGNSYALYKGKVCALTKIKHHAKTIVVPKFIRVNGKKYKVVAIHEVGLFERVDVKKVIIKASNLETVEEPALFKDWRVSHHKKLTVKIYDKETRKWLNARW
jgi:hypothetical protein